MVEADNMRKTPAAQTAASLAPEAFAHADKLRRDAELAYQQGDLGAAQILAERAVAAFQHALVLARIAYAADNANRARFALRTAEKSLAENESDLGRVSAQADDLELRIKVIKDAAPLVSSGGADGLREQARLASARSLTLDAKLLCGAARLVGAETEMLTHAQGLVEEVDKRIASQPRPAPIDAAMRARAECLAALTAARRPASAASTMGKSDQLLAELSAMGGLSPVRDDRGVVVVLRDAFAGKELSRENRERVEALGRVARAHADFPLQVVVHAAGAKAGVARTDAAQDRQRGETVSKALVQAGAHGERIMVEAAGTAHPLLDPALMRDPARNERIEIIFVDPGG
jgi:hypothetical protein